MKTIDLPEWTLKFKKKGYAIRKNGTNYALYKVSSHRVKGLSYPRIEQEYIGTLDENKGLILKKNSDYIPIYIEYGLSNFLVLNFFRSLQRSVFNSKESFSKNIIYLSIINYIFNGYSEEFLKLSYLTKYNEELYSLSNIVSKERVKRLTNKINKLLKEKIPNDNDLNYLLGVLRNTVVIDDINIKTNITYSSKAIEMFNKYGVKYE